MAWIYKDAGVGLLLFAAVRQVCISCPELPHVIDSERKCKIVRMVRGKFNSDHVPHSSRFGARVYSPFRIKCMCMCVESKPLSSGIWTSANRLLKSIWKISGSLICTVCMVRSFWLGTGEYGRVREIFLHVWKFSRTPRTTPSGLIFVGWVSEFGLYGCNRY